MNALNLDRSVTGQPWRWRRSPEAGLGMDALVDELLLARYYQVMERLRQETDAAGSDLMITVPDREVSLLQSEMARRAEADRALDAGGREVKFGTGFGGGSSFSGGGFSGGGGGGGGGGSW